MMELDLALPRTFTHWQNSISIVFITLIPAMIIVPHVVPCGAVLAYICIRVYRTYGTINIEMQRLYMMGIGPILTSFSGYLQGLDTIRAFSKVHAFHMKSHHLPQPAKKKRTWREWEVTIHAE